VAARYDAGTRVRSLRRRRWEPGAV